MPLPAYHDSHCIAAGIAQLTPLLAAWHVALLAWNVLVLRSLLQPRFCYPVTQGLVSCPKFCDNYFIAKIGICD